MSAYGFTEEELESLRKAIKERLDQLPLSPHQRLGFPPFTKGKDVDLPKLSAEATLGSIKTRNLS